MSTKLQQEVWALGRCSGCGGCVDACSKGVLYWGDEGHPLLEHRQKAIGLTRLTLRACEVCEHFCELSCPRLAETDQIPPLSMLSARAMGVVNSGDPNDVIRSLLVAARSAGLIDGVILLDLDPWALQPEARIATSVGEIVSGSGMQYLWAPVLSKLNEAIFERGLTKLAIVGPPCVAEGVRTLTGADHPRLWPYREAIRFTISQFCKGIYLPEMIDALIEQKLGIPRRLIRALTTSITEGTLTVTLLDNEMRTIPLTEVDAYTRRGCASCSDFLGQSADVAIGNVGAEPDHAAVIVRTAIGEVVVQNAIRFELLKAFSQVDQEALLEAQAQKDRRSRAQAFDDLHILMLGAMGDPKKQSQVQKCFVNLYETENGKNKTRRNADVSCGGC